jgi:hypothetical protein
VCRGDLREIHCETQQLLCCSYATGVHGLGMTATLRRLCNDTRGSTEVARSRCHALDTKSTLSLGSHISYDRLNDPKNLLEK